MSCLASVSPPIMILKAVVAGRIVAALSMMPALRSCVAKYSTGVGTAPMSMTSQPAASQALDHGVGHVGPLSRPIATHQHRLQTRARTSEPTAPNLLGDGGSQGLSYHTADVVGAEDASDQAHPGLRRCSLDRFGGAIAGPWTPPRLRPGRAAASVGACLAAANLSSFAAASTFKRSPASFFLGAPARDGATGVPAILDACARR